MFCDGKPLVVDRNRYATEDYVQQVLTLDVARGRTVTVEKMVACSTSRDPATADTQDRAATLVQRAPDFAVALERHDVAWEELWRVCDVVVPRHPRAQQNLRLHISHVLQVCSPHTADLDAGVPARGLSGEAYRGHVFWDELFVYPFLTLRRPEITRGLLMYRYRRLDEARAAARAAGYRGAMYPWQSGSEGSEETQRVHLNPLSGHWDQDRSHYQRHVNAAIFYNVWQYFQATHDHGFLRDRGAEMMLEIARFWASIATFDRARSRYVIHGVMGPDEFHERDPGADGDGLHNNAYTNVMVAWLCGVATEVLGRLPASRARALRERLRLEDEELRTWQDMSRRMFVPFHDGVISQFEGYGALAELDWDGYRERYGDIQRLDRILRAEGDDPNRYQASKQADAVMLPFLFPRGELEEIFSRLGYAYGPECEQRTVSYYDQRTSHGSTLSYLAFAGALAAAEPDRSWERFLMALESDVGDSQNGTTREGIHLGAMAGTLDLLQRCYAGVHLRDDVLCFNPRPPAQLGELSFSLQFRDTPVQVELTEGHLSICALPEGARAAIKVGLCDDVRELAPGGRVSFDLPQGGA